MYAYTREIGGISFGKMREQENLKVARSAPRIQARVAVWLLYS